MCQERKALLNECRKERTITVFVEKILRIVIQSFGKTVRILVNQVRDIIIQEVECIQFKIVILQSIA